MDRDGSGSADAAALTSAYARRWCGEFEDPRIFSPLAVWLLLALVAPAAKGEARDRLEDVLGAPATEAARVAGQLLAEAHPAVAAAVAAWVEPARVLPGFDDWWAGLPSQVERGGIPTQADANLWVSERTGGLIDTLPGQLLDASIALVTAIATDITWCDPFDAASPEEVSAKAVPAEIMRSSSHRCSIVRTDAAGLVAVHAAESNEGLMVVSVIASDDVDRASVLIAAHEVAWSFVDHGYADSIVDLFDLSLGDGPAWTIVERPDVSDPRQHHTAFMRPWAARASQTLVRLPGVAEALETLCVLTLVDEVDAGQAACAAFGPTGFRAAAATYGGVALYLCRPSGRSVRRTFDSVIRTRSSRLWARFGPVRRGRTLRLEWCAGLCCVGRPGAVRPDDLNFNVQREQELGGNASAAFSSPTSRASQLPGSRSEPATTRRRG